MTRSPTAAGRALALGSVLPLLLFALGAMPATATSHEPTTRLGTADEFAILAGSTITNTGQSVITGDVGLHPGTAVTGFDSCPGAANCVDLTGSMHVNDEVAEQAKANLLTAYNELVGLEGTCTPHEVELGGATLTPGVYCSSTFGLTGTLTLRGIGEFIFLTGSGGSALTTAADSEVILIEGADSCAVYWQVASSAVIGARSAFAGNILAHTAISFDTGATLDGSALAMGAAVTLISNTITDTTCAAETTPDDGSDGDDDDGTSSDGDGTASGDDDSTSQEEDGLTALDARNPEASQGRSADGGRDRDDPDSSQNLAKTGPPIHLHLFVALLFLVVGVPMVQMSSRSAPARVRSRDRPPGFGSWQTYRRRPR